MIGSMYGDVVTQPFDNEEITLASGSTTLVYDKANPAQGETSIMSGTVTRLGRLLVYEFQVRYDEDDEFVLELSSTLIPTRIVGLSVIVDNAGVDQIGLACPSDRQIRLNRLDSINDDLIARMTIHAI